MLLACASPIECNYVQEIPCDIWLFQTDVTLGNNIQVIVLGKGILSILTKQREKKIMPHAYYVEGLKHNLMSIGHLIQKIIKSTWKTIIV